MDTQPNRSIEIIANQDGTFTAYLKRQIVDKCPSEELAIEMAKKAFLYEPVIHEVERWSEGCLFKVQAPQHRFISFVEDKHTDTGEILVEVSRGKVVHPSVKNDE